VASQLVFEGSIYKLFVLYLVSLAVTEYCIGFGDWMMNNELERMWKEEIMLYFEVIF
jgi:hypothetical protein